MSAASYRRAVRFGMTLVIPISLLIGGCAVLRPVAAPMPGVDISGHVYDPEGNPLVNCQVVFQRENAPYSEAVILTDALGRFYAENLISSQDWIGFSHPDFSWRTMDKSEFSRDKDEKVVLARRQDRPPAPVGMIDLRVIVKNEHGQPLPGATVLYTIGEERKGEKTTTDPQGVAVIKNVPNREFNYWSIHVHHPDYADGGAFLGRKMDSPDVEITLFPRFTVAGEVVDHLTGEPVENAEVQAMIRNIYDGGGTQGGMGSPKVKGSRFEYTFHTVYLNPPKEGLLYEICANAPGYAWSRAQVVYNPSKDANRKDGIVVALDRGATLKGKVTDSEERPVLGAVCLCFDLGIAELPVDERGHFKFEHWPLYAKSFFFRARGYRDEAINLKDLSEGTTYEIPVVMKKFDETPKK